MIDYPDISLQQKVFFGQLELKLEDQEIRLLKVLMAPDNEVWESWEKLWEIIDDYENALFSCKELMPTAIRKVQLAVPNKDWQSVTGNNQQYLSGLPRYRWSKNEYIINQARIIADTLSKNGIDSIVFKGVAEVLTDKKLGIVRNTNDIDLLIRGKDLHGFKKAIQEIGWRENILGSGAVDMLSLLDIAPQNFFNPNVIFGIDLHIDGIASEYKKREKNIERIWKRRTTSERIPGLFIPSKQDNLLIATVHAFNKTNWISGQFYKYVFDALKTIDSMDEIQINECLKEAENFWGIRNELQQLVSLNSILKLKFSASDQAIIVSNKKRSRNIFLFSVDESFLINLYRLEKIKLFFLKNNFKKGLMKIPLLIKIAADILVLRFFRRGKNKNQGSLHTAENILLPRRINWTFH